MRRRDRGALTFWGIGMVFVLLFAGGVSLDLWSIYATRRVLAESADAAAAAGANGLDERVLRDDGIVHIDPTLAVQLAGTYLVQNQPAELTDARIDVVADVVVVTVSAEVPLTLLGIFVHDQRIEMTVTGQATPLSG